MERSNKYLENNANALNAEQRRIRDIIQAQDERVQRLELEIVGLRQELASVKALAIAQIGRGATSGNIS